MTTIKSIKRQAEKIRKEVINQKERQKEGNYINACALEAFSWMLSIIEHAEEFRKIYRFYYYNDKSIRCCFSDDAYEFPNDNPHDYKNILGLVEELIRDNPIEGCEIKLYIVLDTHNPAPNIKTD